jgi:cytochrome c biogenesis protein CcdA/thiol-disulfide isomerase/thioredoxin
MLELMAIGFVAGIVAGISPCILPVLPVILAAGASPPEPSEESLPVTVSAGITQTIEVPPRQTVWQRQRRPISVVAGVVTSFSLLILVGSEILSALGLPQSFWRDLGVVVLVLVGLAFLIPPLAELLERPFARLTARHQPSGSASGFVIGLALGLLFVPCAGPILAAITVAGATERVGWTAVFLTTAFALGVALPLLVVALAGRQLSQRTKLLREHAPRVRQISGVVILVMAIAIGCNAFTSLQRDVPGYTSALQNRIEGGTGVRSKLNALNGNVTHGNLMLADCNPKATTLINCGMAPNFAGITDWLNTPGGKPLTMGQLRGKVVLVDFWTYSCINCERSLPHVEAWYRDYAKDGFVVVGVHTPEFSFEHVLSNIRSQSQALGVHYPIAVDNNYGTWDAYDNEYWPAEYLIDAQGDVRHVDFGEGGYSVTEGLIRQLLKSAHPAGHLSAATNVPNKTPDEEQNPETYVGYKNLQYLQPENDPVEDRAAQYQFPSSLQLGGLGWSGTWTDHSEEATAGANAKMELGFLAKDVYLVLGGTGTVDVSINGALTKAIDVAGTPRLYTLFSAQSSMSGTLEFTASPGVQAYDFTFG